MPALPPMECLKLLRAIRAAFGSQRGDPNYTEGADLTGDGLVNIQDYNEALRMCRGADGMAMAAATEASPTDEPITYDIGEGLTMTLTNSSRCDDLLIKIIEAFGSTEGPPASINWNPEADLKRDGRINIQDFNEWRRKCRRGDGPVILDLGPGLTATVDVKSTKK